MRHLNLFSTKYFVSGSTIFLGKHPPAPVKKLPTPHLQSPQNNACKTSRSFKNLDQLSEHFCPQDCFREKCRSVRSRVSVLKTNISHQKMFCWRFPSHFISKKARIRKVYETMSYRISFPLEDSSIEIN